MSGKPKRAFGPRRKCASTADVDFRPEVEWRSLSTLKKAAHNARTHSDAQVRQIADSIRRFGFINPLLIGDDGEIIAGHGRLAGAAMAGLTEVPVLKLSHLNAAERRAYMLADNKLALNAGWDQELLAIELQALIDLEFDMPALGFSTTEIDGILDAAVDSDVAKVDAPEDVIPATENAVVTRRGDIWTLGRHRLACGDARDGELLAALLEGQPVDLIFTDPPYNVPIDGHVCGSGEIKHREFAMASGEMSRNDFTAFLVESLSPAALACRDGAIAFVCMDWRHMEELCSAGRTIFAELKNVCVWNKKNAGMGTFYRSKHELIFAFKVGTAKHVNNFGLGDTGRYRTNVWDYAGITSGGRQRREELAMHPTVKPAALVADAIRDCSRRGDMVLDVFGGSGTTLIAAQTCGRISRLIELDPVYCDTIIRRFEAFTGKRARLSTTNVAFDEVAVQRL